MSSGCADFRAKFTSGKVKIRRKAGAFQGFLTQTDTNFAEKMPWPIPSLLTWERPGTAAFHPESRRGSMFGRGRSYGAENSVYDGERLLQAEPDARYAGDHGAFDGDAGGDGGGVVQPVEQAGGGKMRTRFCGRPGGGAVSALDDEGLACGTASGHGEEREQYPHRV